MTTVPLPDLERLNCLYTAGFRDAFLDSALHKIVECQAARDEADLQRVTQHLRELEVSMAYRPMVLSSNTRPTPPTSRSGAPAVKCVNALCNASTSCKLTGPMTESICLAYSNVNWSDHVSLAPDEGAELNSSSIIPKN